MTTFKKGEEYLNDILKNNNIGIKYQELITTDELNDYSKNYYVLSLQKLEKNEYSNDERKILLTLASEHFYYDGIIHCPVRISLLLPDCPQIHRNPQPFK